MFKDASSVIEYFENWLSSEMGFYFKVEYCSCEFIRKQKGNCIWKIDSLVPNSLFKINCETGEIEDTDGYFNNGFKKIFKAKKYNPCFESEPE